MSRFAPAFQQYGVATADCECCDLSYNFRARLKDSCDHADWRLDSSKRQAIVQFRFEQNATDRIRHCRELFDAIHQISELRFIDDQPLVERWGNGALGSRKILLVRCENLRGVIANGVCHVSQDLSAV